ncbi:hypothetical protein FACJOVSR_CDS0107 [Staphylococcus phage PG-2021_67]
MDNKFLEKKRELVKEELDYLHKRDNEIMNEKFKINREIEKLKLERDVLQTENKVIKRRLSQLSEEGYLYVASNEDKKDLNTDFEIQFDIFE